MHSAPALSYPVGRSHLLGWLLGLTGLVALLVGFFWCRQAEPVGWRQGLYAAIVLGAGLVAVPAWLRSPGGSLQWDGQGWSWTDHARTLGGLVTVHLDFQSCLLLCLRADNGGRVWLWPERNRDASRWNALRRAVFSHGATGVAPDTAVDIPRARAKS